MDWKNKLYFGDNPGILSEHVASESVDLIYLDPPFNSSATYVFVAPLYERRRRRSQTGVTVAGEESAAQITAFKDIWQWGLGPEVGSQVIGGQKWPRLNLVRREVSLR